MVQPLVHILLLVYRCKKVKNNWFTTLVTMSCQWISMRDRCLLQMEQLEELYPGCVIWSLGSNMSKT